jgi:hypothetical protein
MKTFFITYELVTSYYMESFDKKKCQNKTALIEAESEELALKTLEKYWANQSDPCGENHWVRDADVAISLKQTEILLAINEEDV